MHLIVLKPPFSCQSKRHKSETAKRIQRSQNNSTNKTPPTSITRPETFSAPIDGVSCRSTCVASASASPAMLCCCCSCELSPSCDGAHVRKEIQQKRAETYDSTDIQRLDRSVDQSRQHVPWVALLFFLCKLCFVDAHRLMPACSSHFYILSVLCKLD